MLCGAPPLGPTLAVMKDGLLPRVCNLGLPRAARLLPLLVALFAWAPPLAAGEWKVGVGGEALPIFRAGTQADPLLAIHSEEGLVVEAKRGGVVIPLPPVDLSETGSRVELCFKAVFDGVDSSSRGFRGGFFNTSAPPLVEDAPQLAGAVFANAEGYLLTSRLTSRSTKESVLVRRSPDEPMLFSIAGGAELGNASEAMDIQPGVEYEVRLGLHRTAENELTFFLELNGRQIALATDTSGGLQTHYNLAGLFFSNAQPSTDEPVKVRFTEFKITTHP